MNGSLLGTLALGFVLGLRHALDADHLVAVSTIVGREKSIWKSAWVGVIWGMGHTASLFVAAVLVIVLRVTISPTVALSLEFCVALMLMVLGADLLWRLLRGQVAIHSHEHAHDDAAQPHAHVHVHVADPEHAASHHGGIGKRPFVVGVIHGLAGSAALMLFVLSTISSPVMGLVYVILFGAGTIGGMLIMSAVIGLPFALASRVLSQVVTRIQFAVGLGSFAFGVFYAWRVAINDGLLAALLR